MVPASRGPASSPIDCSLTKPSIETVVLAPCMEKPPSMNSMSQNTVGSSGSETLAMMIEPWTTLQKRSCCVAARVVNVPPEHCVVASSRAVIAASRCNRSMQA